MTSSMTLEGASSSSSSSTSPRPYDVFLSFRGSDTRHNFTAHLCKTLREKGIHTYMDDKLRMGDEIGPELLKAINESRIAIVVLSENYASSTWCLRELEKILECMETNRQIVMPVFYEVDPSDVRHLKKSFGEALAKHESRNTEDSTVNHWKAALQKVANLSGRQLKKGNEFEVMDQIVHEVITRMAKLIPILDVAKYPVGIESRVEQINALLMIGMNDRRMVGIFGPGGIGKTTIAKAVFNSVACKFEGKCFLDNVRETSKCNGLASLQEKLLFETLGDSSLKVHSVDRGVIVIKERLCNKNVLLVLDDVDELTQLEKLSRECGWFGLGSRIIITTRDESLLAKHGVDLRHKMNDLDDNEAIQLFSQHAFHRDKPNEDFVDLTKSALRYAGGNPLALVVVGSNLSTEDKSHWKSELKKYKRIPPRNIYEILKISYEGLEEDQQNIFLDIACFFKGEDAKYVTCILNNCSLYPISGIKVLIDKSLITNDYRYLVMHDLVQDMGRKIVHEQSPDEPGKRNRLWFHEDVCKVLEENLGTENIKGILVDLPKRGLIQWRSNTFENMKMLKYFICRNAKFSKEPTYLPDELRVLDWTECPLQFLPSSFHGKKLTAIRMRNGPFKGFKKGFENFPNLSIMEFIGLENLTEIPDISRIPNLRELRISECNNLVKVHDSVGFLDKLAHLEFNKCSNLISLPKSLKVRSGGVIFFDNCSSLETFPEIECKVKPSGKGFTLKVLRCRNLIHLSSSIFQLQRCDLLEVVWCPKLVLIPTNVRDEREFPEESRDLFLSPPLQNSSISDVGCSSDVFSAQTGLKLDGINFSSDRLRISGSDIVSLPAWFKTFVKLRILQLDKCKQLQEILELPANIEEVTAGGCVSLKSFPQISRENQLNTSQLPSLQWVDLSDCYKMADKLGKEVEDFVSDKVHYKDSFVGGIIFPGNKIPDWVCHRMNCPMKSRTCIMDIKGLPHLDEIQGIVFCGVLESSPDRFCGLAKFTMRNRGRDIHKRRFFTNMESKNVWYEFFEESFELKGDRLQVRMVTYSCLTIRSFGVHVIHKHEENANNHPDMSRVESYFSFDEANYGWKISTIEDEPDEECENSVGSVPEDESDDEGPELSGCTKVAEKKGNDHVKVFLLEKVLSKDSSDGGLFPGNRIPDGSAIV